MDAELEAVKKEYEEKQKKKKEKEKDKEKDEKKNAEESKDDEKKDKKKAETKVGAEPNVFKILIIHKITEVWRRNVNTYTGRRT